MFHFRRRPAAPITSPVADACEAFLAGSYVDLLDAREEAVPAWAWMNALAHAGAETIATLAAGPVQRTGVPTDIRAWRIVVQKIAADVLTTATAAGIRVEELQALTLTPIEFALMTNPVGPRTTLRLVEGALHRTPGRPPRGTVTNR